MEEERGEEERGRMEAEEGIYLGERWMKWWEMRRRVVLTGG
jgi:hypothetical protein